ncbi:hypothetical protein PL9214650190 [Planktothrix tepida PCC 9214]|uniref:Uncharacterized protein n=1 Tax=Planktothrix tepida PCC 9214 TaxID=671072 RepID=A0A1J1LQP3_9CYAN|nr:hypothetical protein PL9214650190 [Planktothrix tepida PCC 9214]
MKGGRNAFNIFEFSTFEAFSNILNGIGCCRTCSESDDGSRFYSIGCCFPNVLFHQCYGILFTHSNLSSIKGCFGQGAIADFTPRDQSTEFGSIREYNQERGMSHHLDLELSRGYTRLKSYQEVLNIDWRVTCEFRCRFCLIKTRNSA